MSQRPSVSQYVSNPVGQFYAAATGGDSESLISSNGSAFTLHTFLSSGNFVVSNAGFVDLMLIGAGGSTTGSYGNGIGYGGGGGGEIKIEHNFYLPVGTYSVVIGAGIAASGGGRTYIVDSNTLLLSIATGGGLGTGGTNGAVYGSNGGGSGGWGGSNAGGFDVLGIGFTGGSGLFNDSRGGGGAGAAANGVAAGSGGQGGAGRDISLWIGQSAGTTYKAGGASGVNSSGANTVGTGAANTGGGNLGTGWSGIAYIRSCPR